MRQVGLKEKSPNKEHRQELFSDPDQPDALSEYEFFLPEIDGSEEHLREPASGEKEEDKNQNGELRDFFLSV